MDIERKDTPAKLSYKEWQERQKTFKEYVLAFAFSADGSELVLIEKETPEWQKGKFNGVGGKQEWNENAYQAMVREFKEETGVDTDINKWDYFGKMVFKTDVMGGSANVYLFRLFSDDIFQCKTTTNEDIHIVDTWDVFCTSNPAAGTQGSSAAILPNLRVLISLALSKEFKPVVLNGI